VTEGAAAPLIVPEETSLTAPYWEAARKGKIALQRCGRCRAVWHPPQPACPTCQSTDVSWFESAGRASLWSYAVVRQAAHSAVAQRLPYVVALIELEEGPRVICNLLRCEPADIHIGMALKVVLGEAAGGMMLPQAVPLTTAAEQRV
jgi:uncharacterized OB-fold protein